jgi:bifunctional DNA-binding transcriptional regulator/antitoxin component of YhaV-PrlF toxin-antitoxin module
MALIRLTAKRQATLPRQLCDELRVRPGDSLVVAARVVGGERVWLLKPADEVETPWFARFRRYAKGERHDLESVRRSVERERRDGGSEGPLG